MQASTTFSVSGPGGAVAGSFAMSNDDKTVTFTPSADLDEGTDYTVSVAGKQSAGGDNQQVNVSFSFTTEDTTAPTTSEVAVALRAGGQANTNSAPTLISWTATDNVTAAADLVHQLQRRQMVRAGWSAWADVDAVIGVGSVERDESPLGREFQYRVRTQDEAANWSDWAESNVLSIVLFDENAFIAAGWSRVKVPGAAGGRVYRSSSIDATATLSFTGNGVGVVIATGTGQGTVEVCVDLGSQDEACTEVDLATFNPVLQRQVVAAFTGLTAGNHTLRVRVVDGTVNLDAALVSGE